MNASYTKLFRQIGKRNWDAVIGFIRHTRNACSRPKLRDVQLLQVIKEKVWNSFFLVDFCVVKGIYRPKWLVGILNVYKTTFARQQNAWLVIKRLVDITHQTATAKNRNCSVFQSLMVSPVSYGEQISQVFINHIFFPKGVK